MIEAKANDKKNNGKLQNEWFITKLTNKTVHIHVLFERPQYVSTQGLNELDSLQIKFTNEFRDKRYSLPIDTRDLKAGRKVNLKLPR